jgi:hypothetical protein
MTRGIKSYWALTLTLVLGLTGGLFLLQRVTQTSGVDDAVTLPILGLVGIVWLAFQLFAWLWLRNLSTDLPAVDEALLIRSDSGPLFASPRLPEGAAEALAQATVDARRPPAWLELGATTLISLGLAGTFLGLTLGLFEALPKLSAVPKDIDGAIAALLAGARLAFVKSLAGISFAILWSFTLQSVHEVERKLRDAIVEGINARFRAISPEALLAHGFATLRAESAQRQSSLELALQRIDASQENRTRDALDKLLATFRMQLDHARDAAHRSEALRTAVDHAGLRVSQQVERASATLDQRLDAVSREVRGDESGSLAAVRAATANLEDTIRDLSERVPDTIGRSAGVNVGKAVEGSLGGLRDVLQHLASSGKSALDETLRNGLANEVGDLQLALVNVSSALAGMPGLIAAGTASATETLSRASLRGADELSHAATRVAEQTSAAGASVAELRAALAGARELVGALEAGAAEVRDRFGEVARPLANLPLSLEAAKAGMEATGSAAQGAALALGEAGARVAMSLDRAAGGLATSLEGASRGSGEALSAAAGQVRVSLEDGGGRLAEQVRIAGEVLRDGVATELATIRDALRVQRDAQERLAETWQQERVALLENVRQTSDTIERQRDAGQVFADSIEALRAACDATITKLDSITGTQREGSDQAIERLLAAVAAFSASLEENRSAIRDASLQSVASAEQVSVEAARRVADALVRGAEGLESSMARTEQLGAALDARAVTLTRSLESANETTRIIGDHGRLLVDSTRRLKDELATLAQPLQEVHAALRVVEPAVRAAATAMEEERRALTGVGVVLTGQASAISDQERSLSTRTQELRKLHEVLGAQWTGHVDRLVEAHEQVKRAWQEALRAAQQGLEHNAKEVSTYAERVEKALGLGVAVSGLQESLGSLVDRLDDLPPALKPLQNLEPALGSLIAQVDRLRASVDGLAEPEA